MPTPTEEEAKMAFSPAMGITKLEYATTYLFGELICASQSFGARVSDKKTNGDLVRKLCNRAIKEAHIMFEELKKDAES